MFLLTILGIVALGAGIGLQATVAGPRTVDALLAINSAIVSAMEQKKADAMTSFATLAGYSDNVTINSKNYARTVSVAAVTAPDGSGTTTDYKQITVQIGSQSMVCIITQP